MKRIKTIFIFFLIFAVILSSTSVAFAAYEHGDVAAVYVYDQTLGEVLYTYNENIPLPPASTTKMLTALLVLEAVERGEISLDDKVTVTEDTISTLPYDASRMDIPLEPDEIMTVNDLLCAHLISSDCLASNVLGNYVCVNIDDFVILMNTRASELGCENTNFTNPSGYPDENMYTTAHSLYLIAAECMTHELFREIVSTDVITLSKTNLNSERIIHNSNRLLHKLNGENPYYYEHAIGIKTGYSSSSGYCLVSASSYDDHDIYVVVLGGKELIESRSDEYSDSAAYTYTQYTETISANNYFYDLYEKQEFLKNIYEQKTAVMVQTSEAAKNVFNQVISEDAEIVKAFEEKQAQESHTRKLILVAGSITVIATVIIFCSVIFRKKSHKYAKK